MKMLDTKIHLMIYLMKTQNPLNITFTKVMKIKLKNNYFLDHNINKKNS